MKKCNIITLLLTITATICYGQNNAIQDLRRGANILARQFHAQNQAHKAKTLTKFITIIDQDNPDNKLLIASISEKEKIRTYHRLNDDGLAYSEFLMNLLKVLPDNEQTKEKKIYGLYICSVINPAGPATKMLPKGMDFSKFYSDLFEESEAPQPIIKKLMAAVAVKEVQIDTLNYNATELLEAINAINYKLRNTGTQINIETERIKIDSVDDDNGYSIIDGPALKARDKNVLLKNISVLEFLKYLEHTTNFAYKFDGYSVNIIDAQNGSNGRPEFFKIKKTLTDDIQRSLIKSRSNFDRKAIQVKGVVTQIKDNAATFFIELDNVFVVVVNKKDLKANSVSIITEKFTEYAAAQKDGMMKIVSKNQPFLELVVRGECQIKKINQIYINNCNSILAENIGTFYTK